jgi:hypothetical protein
MPAQSHLPLVGSVEQLAHQEEGMANGVAGHPAHRLESVPSVEGRAMEAVGIEADLRTAAAASLALDDLEEAAAKATASVLLPYPQVLDPTGPTPAPAVDPGDKRAALVANRGEDRARRGY